MSSLHEVRNSLTAYRCYKTVWAMKIDKINHLSDKVDDDNGDRYELVSSVGNTVVVTSTYIQRYSPYSGGYYVMYTDGYESFSPAKAFEDGYIPFAVDFSEAARYPDIPDRVTIEHIYSLIESEEYMDIPGTTTTVCVIRLKNGHTSIGEAASVSKDIYDETVGKTIAKKNAMDKIIPLEAYLIRQRKYEMDLNKKETDY